MYVCMCVYIYIYIYIYIYTHTHTHTQLPSVYLVTPCRKILLEKLIVPKLFNTFSSFYRTWWFITLLTTACHWFLPWDRWIPYRSSWPLNFHINFILSSVLWSFERFFPLCLRSNICIKLPFTRSMSCATYVSLSLVLLPYLFSERVKITKLINGFF